MLQMNYEQNVWRIFSAEVVDKKRPISKRHVFHMNSMVRDEDKECSKRSSTAKQVLLLELICISI